MWPIDRGLVIHVKNPRPTPKLAFNNNVQVNFVFLWHFSQQCTKTRKVYRLNVIVTKALFTRTEIQPDMQNGLHGNKWGCSHLVVSLWVNSTMGIHSAHLLSGQISGWISLRVNQALILFTDEQRCHQWPIQRGCDNPRGGRQHTIWPIFPENCMKIKKKLAQRRGRESLAPPLDPPLIIAYMSFPNKLFGCVSNYFLLTFFCHAVGHHVVAPHDGESEVSHA